MLKNHRRGRCTIPVQLPPCWTGTTPDAGPPDLALSMTRNSVSLAVREALPAPNVHGFERQLGGDQGNAVDRPSDARRKGAGYGRRWQPVSLRCRVSAGASRGRQQRLSRDVDKAIPGLPPGGVPRAGAAGRDAAPACGTAKTTSLPVCTVQFAQRSSEPFADAREHPRMARGRHMRAAVDRREGGFGQTDRAQPPGGAALCGD